MVKQKIIGCIETVSFPNLAIHGVVAKIDTGAFSGAIHCRDIHVVRRGLTRKRILKFIPVNSDDEVRETADFSETFVRSSSGHRLKRFIITTSMIMNGETFELKIGLSDRSEMKRDVLIGRRFLRENNILVDVRIHSDLDDEGENAR